MENINNFSNKPKKLRKWQWRIVGLFCIIYFIYYWGRYNYAIALPYMILDLGLTKTAAGAIASALTFGYVIGQIINGNLVDRYGSRIMMTFGGILSGIANVFIGIVSGFSYLWSSWFANGYFQACGYTSTCKLISQWFPRKKRGLPLGLSEFFQSVSSALIIPLGAFLIIKSGTWRMAFIFPGILLMIASFLFYLFVRNKPEDVGIATSWNEKKPEKKISLIQHFKEGAHIALTDRKMLMTYISYGTNQFTRFAIYTWVPVYLVLGTGLDLWKAAWVISFFAWGGSVSSVIYGWLSDKVFHGKRWKLIMINMFISAIGLVIIALNPNLSIYFIMPILLLLGIGIEATETIYFLIPIDLAKGREATGVGYMNAFGKLIASFHGIFLGFIIDKAGYSLAFVVVAIIAVIGGYLVLSLRGSELNRYAKLNGIK